MVPLTESEAGAMPEASVHGNHCGGAGGELEVGSLPDRASRARGGVRGGRRT